MPDTLGKKMSDIPEPAPELIDEARRHCHVAIYPVPRADLIANLIQSLNAGIPVVAGVHWPGYVPPQTGLSQPIPAPPFSVTTATPSPSSATNARPGLSTNPLHFQKLLGRPLGCRRLRPGHRRLPKANLHEALVLELQPAPAR